MAAPVISDFGDEEHASGEAGLTVDGFQFSHFPGELWMFQNANRTGDADELTVGAWGDMQLTGVEIPAAPNNSDGTVYLFLKTENNEWSLPYEFTLGTAASEPDFSASPLEGGGAPSKAPPSPYPRRVMIFGHRYVVRSIYEERRLLEEMRRAELAKLEQVTQPKKVKQIQYKLKRTEKRIQKTEPDMRRNWDEELLALL